MRRRRTHRWAALALAAGTACGGGSLRHDPVPRPTPVPIQEELRCDVAAQPSLAQRQLLGSWVVTFRPDTLHEPAMTGEIRLRADVVRPDLSPAQAACKGCLFGEYFGPYSPLLREPPGDRGLAAIMRADYTMVLSIGSLSAAPNRGDLALCGRMELGQVVGIWWQNLRGGPSGTFAMRRLE